ncbi:hypothetical protein [Flavobacterium sp. 102]|uniref:hypothetical protein n=1 Tax=Flavobacterium sp. 102 TaxID=2135623 RepID=UPI0011C3A965|nr:hypothetical protein [Flavobacterium sp. 102]
MKKILPDSYYSTGNIILKTEGVVESFGWRFFSKPAGLELAFLNTRNLPLLSFFYFFIFLLIREVSIEEKSKNGLEIDISSSERVLNFKAEKISDANQFKTLFSALKFNTLSYRLIFEDALTSLQTEGSIYSKSCCAEGKHLQKTMNYNTECGVAVARARVLFFICISGFL